MAVGGLGASGGLALDEGDRIAQACERLGLDALGFEMGSEAFHDVRDEAQEDRRVGHEELRLVVVANERQPTLQDPAILDMRDLGREVVALDAVGVVEEVERVVDGEPEPRAPSDEPFVDLGRDADLGDLVEDLGRDGQQADERRPGARTEHHLEAPFEGEHLRVEARTGITSVRRSSTLSRTPGSATAFDRWRISSLNRNFSSWSSIAAMVAPGACPS